MRSRFLPDGLIVRILFSSDFPGMRTPRLGAGLTAQGAAPHKFNPPFPSGLTRATTLSVRVAGCSLPLSVDFARLDKYPADGCWSPVLSGGFLFLLRLCSSYFRGSVPPLAAPAAALGMSSCFLGGGVSCFSGEESPLPRSCRLPPVSLIRDVIADVYCPHSTLTRPFLSPTWNSACCPPPS